MKKITIALVTFLLGVSAFNLLHSETTAVSQVIAPIQANVEIPQIQTFDAPIQKVEGSKPFFDSFRDDEGYGGWLIADKFKGMKEVWTILLSRDSENLDSDKLVWSAMVLTLNADGESNDDDDFHSVQIKTDNNRLSFRTNKIRGIEYRFNGEFFKSGKDFSDDEKVVKGTLEKIVKGKTVAKFTADFAYNEPHCFH
jgi:hypothetical protein